MIAMNSKPRRITHRYSEAFKLQVIEQIERGRYTAYEIAKLYGCSPSSIHGWKKKYGKAHLLNKIVRIETMGEANKIKELERQVRQLKESLADAHVDGQLTQSYFKLACQQLGVDPQEFKKKEGVKPLK